MGEAASCDGLNLPVMLFATVAAVMATEDYLKKHPKLTQEADFAAKSDCCAVGLFVGLCGERRIFLCGS